MVRKDIKMELTKLAFDNMHYLYLGKVPKYHYYKNRSLAVKRMFTDLQTMADDTGLPILAVLAKMLNDYSMFKKNKKAKKEFRPGDFKRKRLKASLEKEKLFVEQYKGSIPVYNSYAQSYLIGSLRSIFPYYTDYKYLGTQLTQYKKTTVSIYAESLNKQGNSEELWRQMLEEDGLLSVLPSYLLFDTFIASKLREVKDAKSYIEVFCGTKSKKRYADLLMPKNINDDLYFLKQAQTLLEEEGLNIE